MLVAGQQVALMVHFDLPQVISGHLASMTLDLRYLLLNIATSF